MTVLRKISLPFLTGLAFSGSFIAAKYTTVDLTPLVTTLLRYVIALLFFVGLMIIRKQRVFHVEPRHIPAFIVLGLSGIVGYHFFFFASLHHTSVANTAIINGLSPAITGVMAALFIGERLSAVNWLGIAMAMAGVMILVTKGNITVLTGFDFNYGDLLMLTAVVCWSVYALAARRMLDRYSALTVTLLASLFGVAVLILMVIPEDLPGQLRAVSQESIWALLYMGIAASGFGYLLYNLSIRSIGPTRTSGFVYSTVPLLTGLLALIFFSEPVTLTMLIATILVIIGLQLALREPAR
jgi:drug/metabolite transporter (DMT)-like permease